MSRVSTAGPAQSPFLDMLDQDPPEHTHLRRLISPMFTPRAVERLRPDVRNCVERLIDEILPSGSADLVSDVVEPLSRETICGLLGVPEEHRDFIKDVDNLKLAADSLQPDPAAVAGVQAYFQEILEAKRSNPADDVLTFLTRTELSDPELRSMAFLIIGAGYATAAAFLAGVVARILEHPELWRKLRADRAFQSAIVEEALRFDSAVQLTLERYALTDLEIAGERIEKGDALLIALASANRDPQRFPDADSFDHRRSDNHHLAFGHGAHYCLGAALARLEAAVTLDALVRRLPDLRLAIPADDITWGGAPRIRTPMALPVEFSSTKPHPGLRDEAPDL